MSDAPKQPAAYKVGYRRPPAEHRFKKGVSGNPSGRPRAEAPKPTNPGYAELDDILLAEALRPVTVRENDEIVEMPMIQAVLRSLGVQAVKGHHRSQLALANMVKAVQSARYQDRVNLFKSAVEYKDSWKEAFEEADRKGEPRPEPVPHPDEIILNSNDLTVKFNGPIGPDDKAHWDMMLQRKADALEEIAFYEAKLKRPGKYTSVYEQELKYERRLVEIISATIPDAETRRRPGFDLVRWRDQQPVFQEMQRDRRAKRRRGSAKT